MGYASVTDWYRHGEGDDGLSFAAMAKVLIAEDDRVIAQGVSRHLESAEFTPVVVDNGARLRGCSSSSPTCASST